MPNHVTSKLYIKDKVIREAVIDYLYENVCGFATFMTFGKILPIPEYVYKGPLGAEERSLYGEHNWYDWCIENWGTKWDAYNSFIDDEERITFDTAWEGVPKIIGMLSQKFPNSDFDYKYADEDAGNNVDHYKFNSGQILEHDNIKPWSYTAYKTYIDCKDLQDYYKIYMNRNSDARLVHSAVKRYKR